jgi:hypothetical protein
VKRLFALLFVATAMSGAALAQQARQIKLGTDVNLGGMRAYRLG